MTALPAGFRQGKTSVEEKRCQSLVEVHNSKCFKVVVAAQDFQEQEISQTILKLLKYEHFPKIIKAEKSIALTLLRSN